MSTGFVFWIEKYKDAISHRLCRINWKVQINIYAFMIGVSFNLKFIKYL
jgi:hypothetical protein